jgi:hypothetical protein
MAGAVRNAEIAAQLSRGSGSISAMSDLIVIASRPRYSQLNDVLADIA